MFCDNCGRYFLQESCFESHKALKLCGEYKSYCEFLCTLRNCDECRRAFNLSIKCRHFGKKRKCVGRNVYFSDVVVCNKASGGGSSYVKCGLCSDYYVRGFSGSHACFLRKSNSLFGDGRKRSKTIHAHNVFFYDIESRLEERFECRFQSMNDQGNCATLRKSVMVDNMERVEECKQDLTVEQLSCIEVIKCHSHQPTLLCVVNASQSSKRHFCEMVNQQDIVISFFK